MLQKTTRKQQHKTIKEQLTLKSFKSSSPSSKGLFGNPNDGGCSKI